MKLEEPRTIAVRPLRIAGLDEHYAFNRTREIPAQWERFAPMLGRVPGQVDKVTYGVCHEMGEAGFRYTCGVEVADEAALLSALSVTDLPAHTYAVFAYDGPVSRLSEACEAIWQTWLPASGREVVDAPVMIERYGEAFDPAAGSVDIEIWLAIKP